MTNNSGPPQEGDERTDETVGEKHVLEGGHPSYGLDLHDEEPEDEPDDQAKERG